MSGHTKIESQKDASIRRANKRILIEIKKFLADKTLEYVELRIPDKKNARNLQFLIQGPEGTPYAEHKYDFRVFLGDEYPKKPPSVRCVTKIYHPNINGSGEICLSILKTGGKEGWSPVITLDKLALSLHVLMQSPNHDDPLVASITQHFKNFPEDANAKAKQWAEIYAIPV
jgi:ubiquitin-protein ligase